MEILYQLETHPYEFECFMGLITEYEAARLKKLMADGRKQFEVNQIRKKTKEEQELHDFFEDLSVNEEKPPAE